jgi:hypothetical protein
MKAKDLLDKFIQSKEVQGFIEQLKNMKLTPDEQKMMLQGLLQIVLTVTHLDLLEAMAMIKKHDMKFGPGPKK